MRRKCLFVVLTCSLLLSVSACQGVTPIPPTPATDATIMAEMKNNANIQPGDNGKTFTYRPTDRFIVFLDDEKYPVKDLACTPEGIIGYVSNGSLRGPDLYPVMFETVKEGRCRLTDHDFHVDIVVQP